MLSFDLHLNIFTLESEVGGSLDGKCLVDRIVRIKDEGGEKTNEMLIRVPIRIIIMISIIIMSGGEKTNEMLIRVPIRIIIMVSIIIMSVRRDEEQRQRSKGALQAIQDP
jgi:hypothetical protein